LPLLHSRSDAARVVNGTPTMAPQYALLVFAKQHLCDDSTVALFARERGLTGAEAQVLTQVCKGLRPAQVAVLHGVRISTVRTQLRSIRMKTQCQTIRELVQKVSVLPPTARHLCGHPAG
jgi:DNA-binding CsgD family transcriptional regulator